MTTYEIAHRRGQTVFGMKKRNSFWSSSFYRLFCWVLWPTWIARPMTFSICLTWSFGNPFTLNEIKFILGAFFQLKNLFHRNKSVFLPVWFIVFNVSVFFKSFWLGKNHWLPLFTTKSVVIFFSFPSFLLAVTIGFIQITMYLLFLAQSWSKLPRA